jgi:hypothetical protein
MNYWTELSIEYANQKSYLDDLFQVYPTIPDGIRDINKSVWEEIVEAYNNNDNSTLVQHLLRLEKFPFKDSYVNFLRLDPNSFARNPNTINRLAGMTFNIGLEKLYEKCSEPKETNTQMGGKFGHWINKGVLGVLPVSENEFLANNNNAILAGGDRKLTSFAKEHFGYSKAKGLDFIGRFNGKYVIGEAKFISAIGGNQGTAFTDVITTITADIKNAIPIGIVDGIPWIKDKSPYYKAITTTYSDHNILSSLVLQSFLYQI